jgi:hypothetical protein
MIFLQSYLLTWFIVILGYSIIYMRKAKVKIWYILLNLMLLIIPTIFYIIYNIFKG